MERGLLMALVAVVLWGVLDAGSRYAVVTLAADPWVFSCLNLITGAVVLLAMSRGATGGLETVKNLHTWVFGFFRVLMTLCLVFAFTAISASEVNFMLRINVVMGLVAAWAILGRRPRWTDVPGLIMLIGGFGVLAWRQGHTPAVWAVGLVVLAAVCDTILTLIAETHPASRKSAGLKARCRYTGFVLLATSVFFWLMAFGLALLKGQIHDPAILAGPLGHLLHEAPALHSFTNPATIGSALVIGLFLRAPSMYLYLYAARLMKSENLMMIATLAPFATLAAESIFVAGGWLEARTLDMGQVAAGVCMTLGALSMVLFRVMNQRKKLADERPAPHA